VQANQEVTLLLESTDPCAVALDGIADVSPVRGTGDESAERC